MGFNIPYKFTKNSGAAYMDGDVVLGNRIRWRTEEKNHKKPIAGVGIKKKDWEDIVEKSMKHGGRPVLVTKNGTRETLVTLLLNDFLDCVQEFEVGS